MSDDIEYDVCFERMPKRLTRHLMRVVKREDAEQQRVPFVPLVDDDDQEW